MGVGVAVVGEYVPRFGGDQVVSAIVLDGMDLVILGPGGTAVAPTRARGVTARARSKGSVLIVTDGHWDGSDVRIESRISKYGGIGYLPLDQWPNG